MTTLFALVNQTVLDGDETTPGLSERLTVATGKNIAVKINTPVMVDVLDEEGQPTGRQKFSHWQIADGTAPEMVGGLQVIERFKNWCICQCVSTSANLRAIATGDPNNFIIIEKNNRARINQFLSGEGKRDIPVPRDDNDAVDKTVEQFKPGFDRKLYSVGDPTEIQADAVESLDDMRV